MTLKYLLCISEIDIACKYLARFLQSYPAKHLEVVCRKNWQSLISRQSEKILLQTKLLSAFPSREKYISVLENSNIFFTLIGQAVAKFCHIWKNSQYLWIVLKGSVTRFLTLLLQKKILPRPHLNRLKRFCEIFHFTLGFSIKEPHMLGWLILATLFESGIFHNDPDALHAESLCNTVNLRVEREACLWVQKKNEYFLRSCNTTYYPWTAKIISFYEWYYII